MKLKVIQKNARADGKPIEVGKVLNIKGDTIPASLVGKVQRLDDEEKTAITNPAEQPVQQPADAKSAAEVLALAETAHFMTFKAEATKLLGDKTPGSKAEIVAALEDLATKPE